MEHDQHVPDEGDIVEDQGSEGEWIHEYLYVNHELTAHVVRDRAYSGRWTEGLEEQ